MQDDKYINLDELNKNSASKKGEKVSFINNLFSKLDNFLTRMGLAYKQYKADAPIRREARINKMFDKNMELQLKAKNAELNSKIRYYNSKKFEDKKSPSINIDELSRASLFSSQPPNFKHMSEASLFSNHTNHKKRIIDVTPSLFSEPHRRVK